MKQTWLIADTHFRHAKLADGVHRPFANADEMDEALMDEWAQMVGADDTVYHLGDVVFGKNKQDWLETHMPKLPGKKRLVLGNHDNVKACINSGVFKSVTVWEMRSEILLTHVPVHPSVLDEGRFDTPPINIHGHIHARLAPTPRHICVSVEQTNYAPVNLEMIRANLKP